MSEIKKYKVTYRYEDEFNNTVQASEIIDAISEEHAYIKIYDRFFNDNPEIEECYEIVDHPILNKVIYFDMPDGMTYGLSVELEIK